MSELAKQVEKAIEAANYLASQADLDDAHPLTFLAKRGAAILAAVKLAESAWEDEWETERGDSVHCFRVGEADYRAFLAALKDSSHE